MCMLSFVVVFTTAHLIAWSVLGGGWRGAIRAPFAIFLPSAAVLLIDGLVNDSTDTFAQVVTLLSWELAYLFLYLCLRVSRRAIEPAQLAGPRR